MLLTCPTPAFARGNAAGMNDFTYTNCRQQARTTIPRPVALTHVCRRCGVAQPHAGFSNRQWLKPEGVGRCRRCISKQTSKQKDRKAGPSSRQVRLQRQLQPHQVQSHPEQQLPLQLPQQPRPTQPRPTQSRQAQPLPAQARQPQPQQPPPPPPQLRARVSEGQPPPPQQRGPSFFLPPGLLDEPASQPRAPPPPTTRYGGLTQHLYGGAFAPPSSAPQRPSSLRVTLQRLEASDSQGSCSDSSSDAGEEESKGDFEITQLRPLCDLSASSREFVPRSATQPRQPKLLQGTSAQAVRLSTPASLKKRRCMECTRPLAAATLHGPLLCQRCCAAQSAQLASYSLPLHSHAMQLPTVTTAAAVCGCIGGCARCQPHGMPVPLCA